MNRQHALGRSQTVGLLANCSVFTARPVFSVVSVCSTLESRPLTRGKSTRPAVSSKTNNSEDEVTGGRGGQPRSEARASSFPMPDEEPLVARRTRLEDTAKPRLAGAESYTSIKGDNVQGSPDGVDKIAKDGAPTSAESSELSAPPVGTEMTGVWIDPDETIPLEMKGQPQEIEATGLEAPSEIRRQSDRVDIQGVVESPAKGKQELLYAAHLGMRSPHNEGQPMSVLAEVSC